MTRYVALLRGVNVGGVTMKMADVATVFTNLGLVNVKTVLASGNVRFDSDRSPREIKPAVEAALSDAFSYQARIHLTELAEIQRVVDEFPFDAEREGWHPYVIFLTGDEPRRALLALEPELDPGQEEIAAGRGVVYWTVVRGRTLDSVVGKATGSGPHKALTTTRNLRTLQKVLR